MIHSLGVRERLSVNPGRERHISLDVQETLSLDDSLSRSERAPLCTSRERALSVRLERESLCTSRETRRWIERETLSQYIQGDMVHT